MGTAIVWILQKICVNFSLLPAAETATDIENSKYLKDKIASNVSWRQEEIDVQNDILNGKLREPYTYQVPLTAIVSATVFNLINFFNSGK